MTSTMNNITRMRFIQQTLLAFLSVPIQRVTTSPRRFSKQSQDPFLQEFGLESKPVELRI